MKNPGHRVTSVRDGVFKGDNIFLTPPRAVTRSRMPTLWVPSCQFPVHTTVPSGPMNWTRAAEAMYGSRLELETFCPRGGSQRLVANPFGT